MCVSKKFDYLNGQTIFHASSTPAYHTFFVNPKYPTFSANYPATLDCYISLKTKAIFSPKINLFSEFTKRAKFCSLFLKKVQLN